MFWTVPSEHVLKTLKTTKTRTVVNYWHYTETSTVLKKSIVSLFSSIRGRVDSDTPAWLSQHTRRFSLKCGSYFWWPYILQTATYSLCRLLTQVVQYQVYLFLWHGCKIPKIDVADVIVCLKNINCTCFISFLELCYAVTWKAACETMFCMVADNCLILFYFWIRNVLRIQGDANIHNIFWTCKHVLNISNAFWIFGTRLKHSQHVLNISNVFE